MADGFSCYARRGSDERNFQTRVEILRRAAVFGVPAELGVGTGANESLRAARDFSRSNVGLHPRDVC